MTRRAGSGVLAVWAAFLLAVPLAQAHPAYVFPVAVDPGWLVWDEQHWDRSHAVDIGIHPAFGIDASERAQFYASDVLAVVAGRARLRRVRRWAESVGPVRGPSTWSRTCTSR